tara:strand:- start:6458 stop:7117 length:660 start_codon:yes stop_codon:yes gene_type:complete
LKNPNYLKQFKLSGSFYFDKLDFISWNRYFQVIKSFQDIKAKSILEVGSGDYVVKSILEPYVDLYETFDINPNMNPTYKGDIRTYKKSIHNKYDLIIITDVLEHIPFEDVSSAFSNMYKYLKKNGHIILTVPHRRTWFSFFSSLNLTPKMISLKNGILSPKAFYRNFILKKPWIDPHHCYEIGINGITISKFEGKILENNFKIIKSKQIPYVNFWCIKK